MTQPAANSLIALRLPELSAVAQIGINDANTSAVAALTRRLAIGDEDAYRQFQVLYFDRLYRFLLVVARGDETQAHEALQETFVRVARHPRVFECEDAFWNWLKAVARNTARDAGRKQRRYSALLEKFMWRSQTISPSIIQEDTLAVALEESIGELDADDRVLIEGKYMNGHSVRELAGQAGLTEKAVESRLLRLRRQLREKILKKLKRP